MTDPLHQAEEVLSLEDLLASARQAVSELQDQDAGPVAMMFLAMNDSHIRMLYRQAPISRRLHMLASAEYIHLRESWGNRA